MKNYPILIFTISSITLVNCSHKMTRSSGLKVSKLEKSNSYLVPLDASVKQNLIYTDDNGKIKMLSEVSPDAIVTNVTSITSNIVAKLAKGESFTAEQITSIAQNVTEFGKRTVAVNVLRDALFRLEEYNLNNNGNEMDTSTFILFTKILDVAQNIASAEISAEKTKQQSLELKIEEEQIKSKLIDIQNNSNNSSVLNQELLENRLKRATGFEEEAYKNLIEGKFESAIENFNSAESNYPTLHNNFELSKMIENNLDILKSNDNNKKKEIYSKILKEKSWGMPIEIKKKLEDKIKN